ncbi:hypothetical protein XENTR_v10012156 [Xenopus tropicalis]|nr:hypothetical protein XENTR_v10012156 [Xenopus tropicalis]
MHFGLLWSLQPHWICGPRETITSRTAVYQPICVLATHGLSVGHSSVLNLSSATLQGPSSDGGHQCNSVLLVSNCVKRRKII